MSRSSSAVFLAALAPWLPGCGAFDWQESPELDGIEWRGREVYRTERDLVLATSEGAAGNAAEFLQRVRAGLLERSGWEPGPGVVIAVGYDDPLLFGEPVQTIQALTQAHRVFVQPVAGAPSPDADIKFTYQMPGDDEPLTKEEMAELAAPIVPGAMEVTAEELDLPVPLQVGRTWVYVHPTDACLEEFFGEVLTEGMKRKGINMAMRAMVWMFARSELEEALVEVRAGRDLLFGQMLLALAAAGGAPEDLPQDVATVLGLGIDSRGALSASPQEPTEQGDGRVIEGEIRRDL